MECTLSVETTRDIAERYCFSAVFKVQVTKNERGTVTSFGYFCEQPRDREQHVLRKSNTKKIQMEELQQMHEDSEKFCERKDSTSSVSSDSNETKLEVNSFREKLKYIIHSHKFQIIIICIVVLDCLLVIAELLFDLEIIHTSEHSEVPHILHYASIGLLSLFIIELIVKLYAVRLEFFHHKIEIFDAIIIIVSFALDIVFRNTKGPESGTGLLIVLRLWRVVRIINGIVVSVKKEADEKIHKERKQREKCEEKLTKYRGYYTAQQEEIKALRSLLHQHGITDIVPRWVGNIDVVDEVSQLPEKTFTQLETNDTIQEVPSAAVM